MYQESGPVVETPLSAAQSMHDMLCQSWGDLIRIFPAVPDDWQDVTLHDFRTQGAFLVSAVRRGGMTRFVRVRSEKGAPCRLRHSLTGPVTVAGARHRDLGGGVIEIDLRAGQEAIVYTGRTDFTIAPVRASAPSAPWGLPSRPAPRAFTPLDLSALYTGDGIATASVPANFDGKGFAYPAEALPPAGPVTLHGVPFTFPGGDRNYLLCAGQTVPVPPARYAKVWFLAAATTYNAYPNPGANYVDGASVPMPLTVTEWSRGSAAFNDVEAITAPYRYGPAGREDRKVSIYLQVAELDPTTDLVSLALPTGTAPELRVFAISLEKA